ncbi:hypothetical protein HMF8227_00067 [Saliniradius amylolyticus]|uniref:DUF2489 domain-containing protein n=1 Tax=Saliniradius amylolyticus TaxID=2183582 RepID=A0A2S2DYV1_9ALTE|nr:hypothetical protein [Saliniradius amylolyticus]AWL10575.1 hypothetical protein HMF8227_00067 [Saliniradius amylolyticus]
MILYTIIGVAILLACFFMVRCQGMQAQLRQALYYSQQADKRKREILGHLTETAEQLQQQYLDRLEMAYQAGWVNAERYEKSRIIVSHYCFVILSCVDKQLSVSAAMNKVATRSQTPLEDIQRFISLQRGEVRNAWSSNQVAGFTRVCNLLTSFQEAPSLANAS